MIPEPTESRVWKTLTPICEEKDLVIVDISFSGSGAAPLLSVVVDRAKTGGIDVETCAEVSEELSRHLDVEDIIKSSYKLEVSSPGINRVLKKPCEFNAMIGRMVAVRLKQSYEGVDLISGTLIHSDESGFAINAEGEEFELSYESVQKVNIL